MAFNLPAFLESTFNPEGFIFDTKVALVPPCESEIEVLRFDDGSYNHRDTGARVPAVRVQWLVCDPQIQEQMGIKDPQAQQFIELEFDDNGNLIMAKNRNVRLSRGLLEPLGFNKGKKWSFPQLLHMRAWGRIELPRDEEVARYSNVVAVGAKQADIARRQR